MFLIRFLRWLFGWIRFEAEGGFPERLLNLAAHEDIDLWGVRRQGVKLKACCPVREYRRLRSPAHKAGMRMRVTERHGVPFTVHRYRARSGLAAGLAVFFTILQLLSQRVWVIQVRGNEKVGSDEILSVMEGFGVREGADLSKLDIPNLQLAALQKLPDLAWCTVNLSGSVAYVDVTERVPKPEIADSDTPSNIKATCDGRIVSIETFSGQAMVKKGDAVVKGMILVSGVVESKVGSILKRSQAHVEAETTHKLEVSVPLRETLLLPTGEVIMRPSLHFFAVNIPLYTDGPIDDENTVTMSRHPLTANGIALPIGIINKRYELLKQTEVVRTEEEAKQLAAQKLAEKAETELSAAEIKSSAENGCMLNDSYVLTGEYACIEDIGAEEPILIENTN